MAGEEEREDVQERMRDSKFRIGGKNMNRMGREREERNVLQHELTCARKLNRKGNI